MSKAGPGEIEVRHVGSGDADLFSLVADVVFDGPVDRARLAAYLADPGHHMIVAISGCAVIGQVAAVVHRHPDKPTELYIDEVGVAPAFHRRGIARRMLAAMFAWGREQGCEEAWVGTEPSNLPARRLYESCGAEAEAFVMYVYEL